LPVVQFWAEEISAFGIFNFLLSDAEFLYAHRSTRLSYVSRQYFSASECLRSEELTIRLAEPRSESQRLALVATEPLTSNEEWVSLPAGEVVVFRKGSKTE
jgi:glutamine amidotransferase